MKDRKQMLVRVPKDLHQAARIKSVREGRPLSEVIREMLEKWVKPDDKPTPQK